MKAERIDRERGTKAKGEGERWLILCIQRWIEERRSG
jgi:hypothetical protein